MKNSLLSFIAFIFVYVFVANSVNAQVSCPSGYNGTTIVLGPDAAGCSWEVDICYKCDITGINPSNVKIGKFKPTSTSNCTYITKEELITLLLNQYYELKCDNIPDCVEDDYQCAQSQWLSLDYPVCYQWHVSGSFNPFPPPSGTWTFKYWLESCPGQGYCQMDWYVCRDPETQVIHKCKGSTVTYTEHNITCTTIKYAQPSEPAHIPANIGDHTHGPCFQEITDCHD
jgi:hypothetical protein